MSYPASCGHTGQHLDDRWETLPSLLHTDQMQSSPQRQACPQPGLPYRAEGTKVKNMKDTWIGLTKSEKVQPSGWPHINKEILPTTIGKSGPVPLKSGLWFSGKSLRTLPKRESGSSKLTRKGRPTSSQRLESLELTIYKSRTKCLYSVHGMYVI